jgi:RNA polymerase sigma-70 factor (ECF subfamily)
VPPPDRAILEGVRRREPDALGAFYEHYFDTVYALTYRLLGNRAGAEDATQEVFYKLHRAAEQLDLERDPTAWVMTIALNACRSLWRSAAHRMEVRSASIDEASDYRAPIADRSPNPEEAREAAERERHVQEALMELPEEQRIIVILKDYQGLSHKRIAGLLDLGHDAVRKRYSRALAELSHKLRGRLG